MLVVDDSAVMREMVVRTLRMSGIPETLRATIIRVTGVTDAEYYGPVSVTSDDGDF